MSNGWHRKRLDTPAEQARKRDYNGAEHKRLRNARVADATPWTPCTCPGENAGGCKHHVGPCAKALGPNTREWHLPHNTTRTGYLPGLWCGPCNRSEAASRAARKTNTERRKLLQPPFTKRAW